jgi:hypothetical protein
MRTKYGGTAKTKFWAILPLNLTSAKDATWSFSGLFAGTPNMD